MKIDPITTAISDLTDEEAAALRSLCEDMLRGPVALDHPLYVAFMDVFMPDHAARGVTAIGTTAFLPRALHALLVREREACAAIARAAATTGDVWVTAITIEQRILNRR